MGPQLCSCGNREYFELFRFRRPRFNGAATLQLRKRAASRPAGILSQPASMGPQLCSCGNLDYSSYQTARGIMRLQWGRNFAVAETRPCPQCPETLTRFNGAATLQLRKRYHSIMYTAQDGWLQWGRNFAVAETQALVGTFRVESMPLASMGPQLCSCGNDLRRATWCQARQA